MRAQSRSSREAGPRCSGGHGGVPRVIRSFLSYCSRAQQDFSRLTFMTMAVCAAGLLIDTLLLRTWLQSPDFGYHAPVLTPIWSAEIGWPINSPASTGVWVKLDADALIAIMACSFGFATALAMTILFAADCTIRLGAFIHRRRVRRNIDHLLRR